MCWFIRPLFEHNFLVYGVAMISRLLKIIGLFYKRALQKRPIFYIETYNSKEPTNRSHPIVRMFWIELQLWVDTDVESSSINEYVCIHIHIYIHTYTYVCEYKIDLTTVCVDAVLEICSIEMYVCIHIYIYTHKHRCICVYI